MVQNPLSEAPQPPTELGRLRVMAPAAGIRVSPLALGGMSIGNAWSTGMGAMDKEAAFKLLDAFVAAGGNFIDTANNYQDEQSELWLGEWMRSRQNRDQMVIATKFSADYQSHALGKGNTANFSGNHRRSIHMSVRDSLKKLGTDFIDILYIHYWDFTTSIKEVMDSLHRLVDEGKVLYLGASDMPAWIVSAANVYATDHGKSPFSIYQGRWSIMQRDFERDIIPMAKMFGMALVPWGVLGGGKFQSATAIQERKKSGQSLRKLFRDESQTELEVKISNALAKVASDHGTESVTAIALAYVRHKAPNVIPIVGGRRIEQLHDNIAALSIKLTDQQIAFLEEVAPLDIGFPNNFIGEDPNITGKSSILARSSQLAFPNAIRQTSL